jgi:CheY-like chemotaxis protein
VEIVSDAPSLMSRLRRAPPAVLLLNSMKDARSVDVAEQVRSLRGNDDLVLVLLFDSFDHIDTQQLARLNVQAWLSKTRTTRDTLSETITRLVGKGARRQA